MRKRHLFNLVVVILVSLVKSASGNWDFAWLNFIMVIFNFLVTFSKGGLFSLVCLRINCGWYFLLSFHINFHGVVSYFVYCINLGYYSIT